MGANLVAIFGILGICGNFWNPCKILYLQDIRETPLIDVTLEPEIW